MDYPTQLLQEALKLPENQRADMAARLLESLDPACEDRAESEWAEEIQRRLEQVQRGEVACVPWEEALRLIGEDSDDAPVT